jgi:hypothetical protein
MLPCEMNFLKVDMIECCNISESLKHTMIQRKLKLIKFEMLNGVLVHLPLLSERGS